MKNAKINSFFCNSKVIKCFLFSVGILLLFTGFAKICSAFGKAELLIVKDPLIDIPFRDLLLVAGVLEVAISYICFFGKNSKLIILFIACFATNLLFYRIGLWCINWYSPCHCLGNLTDAIHVSPQLADNIMKGVLAYLLFGSYTILLWFWIQHKKLVSFSMPRNEPA